ncbi:MAG: hypothetical protein KAQ95_03660, partial [Candidatus Heimdallarchaeota archaeon]|nr:hypothetical protein [Candidatus Heimdallarchaeota archaeon]
SAIIFVVDSADRDRIEEAKIELWKVLLDPQYPDAPLLIVANKQDKVGAMPVEDIVRACNLDDPLKMGRRSWHIQPTVATTGQGVEEAIKWIVIELDKL